MSDIISAADYKAIADSYATARQKLLDVQSDLFDAVYQVVMINSVVPEVDLLERFWGVYQVGTNTTTSAGQLLDAVRALNGHVIARGNYSTIDDFFAANPGLVVDDTWADLSEEAGYPIDNAYVSDYI